MRAMSKATQKQLLLNHYNDLREKAVEEVSQEIMQQTACLMLFSMSLMENNPYSDEELKKIYEQFIDVIHWEPGMFFGKSLHSPDVTKEIADKLGIDLNKIDTHFKQI